MARRSKSGKDDFFVTLFTLAAGAVSVLFLINSLIVNRHFSAKYKVPEAESRVSDSGNILRFGKELLTIGFLVILLIPACIAGEVAIVDSVREFLGARFPGIDAANLKLVCDVILAVLAIISTGAILLVCLGISAHIGTSQIGMLVFPEKGIFVIPADSSKNTFVENVF